MRSTTSTGTESRGHQSTPDHGGVLPCCLPVIRRNVPAYAARSSTTHRTDPPPPVLNSEMAIFGPGGHVHVRSRTEKRPSSRPLLLSNRPLFAVYMPYLLSYCAEQRKEGIEDKRSAACRPVHSLARQRDRRRAAARPLCGVRAVTRVLAAGRTTKRERPFI